jgi:HAD superfamily hydrolase (TIGR01509 family)
MKDFRTFLFDLDGTLVNSEPLKGQAIVFACQEFGIDAQVNDYKTVMGESWLSVTEHFFRHQAIKPNSEAFRQCFKEHYQTLLRRKVTLTPGVREYIFALRAQNKPCGIVSSAAMWMVEEILAQHDLTGAFDCIITQEQVTQHKPHPEAYHVALNKLSATPQDTLVFEDSTAGISAGLASGCDVIAVQHEFNLNNDLSAASHIISGFQQLK